MDENHTRICKQMDKRRINKTCQDPHVCFDYFNVDEVTEQLRKQKQ